MEANRLAEFRVRRREICLIVNSDDRRVGICSLRGACVAAALRAARREAQRILFKKSGLQNCDPPFLIFFYFLRQTEGIKRTSSGMISRRPSSMMALIVHIACGLFCIAVCMTPIPTRPRAWLTALIAALTAVLSLWLTGSAARVGAVFRTAYLLPFSVLTGAMLPSLLWFFDCIKKKRRRAA